VGALERFRDDPLSDPGAVRMPGRDTDVTGKDPLDSPLAVQTHQWLLGNFLYEKRRQGPNRRQMALDHDYYDSEQFTDEDLVELADRGQEPLVYNLVKRTADWVIGTEKRTRFDFKVLGRTRDDVQAARSKTDAMKYLSDVNNTPFARSQAFREMVISGLSWMETGLRGDDDEEPIYTTNESWWQTLGDSHAMKLDNRDARYHFRFRHVDQDVALAMFPNREHLIKNDTMNAGLVDEKEVGDWYLGNRIMGEDYAGHHERRLAWSNSVGFVDSSRERVRLYEGWFKKPVRERTMRAKQLPQFHGEAYDAKDDDMRHALLAGDASVVERVNMRVFYCIFTESGVLAAGRSPYRHNEFPFTPFWCYRRGRDNAPYGIIRGIRDPQDGFNRRMAKSIFAYTAYRVIASADAIDPKKQSWENVRNEAGRPDGLLVKKNANATLEVQRDTQVGDAQFKIAQTEASLILDASGVTADNLGLESNATSGKAILAKQAEGSAVTAEIFDNYRFGCQIHHEKELANIEQFWSEEKVLRITDAKGNPSYNTINQVQENEKTGEPEVLNDITKTKADFVLDPQDFHATVRQASSEAIMAMLPKVGNLEPRLVLRLLRMAADASDWPNKEEIVKELDQITGYKDPAGALTPEEQEEQQKAEQEQRAQAQKQAEQQDAAFKAELEAKLATAEQSRAQADKARADADKTRSELGVTNDPAQAEALAKQAQEAQELVEQKDMEISTLQQQIASLGADREAEKYKADRDKEARVEVADRQFREAAPNPEKDEAIADIMQDLQSFGKLLKDVTGMLAKEQKDIASQVAELAKKVESSAHEQAKDREITKVRETEREKAERERTAKGKEDKAKPEKGQPAIVINNIIPKPAKAKGKTVKFEKDGSARIEPDPDNDED
jgi:hypothetical protein